MSSTFLSSDEVAALTGFKTAMKQKAQLRRQKIPYREDCRGNPIIMRSVLERVLEGKKEEKADYSAVMRANLERMIGGAL